MAQLDLGRQSAPEQQDREDLDIFGYDRAGCAGLGREWKSLAEV